MQPTIGFTLVTHNNPEQILHLCRRLGAMFGDPPIALHHDFSQADLDRSVFPTNVTFVKNWHRTRWGDAAVLDAQLAALRLLRESADPEWYVTLSAADYPIQTPDQMLAELAAAGVDVLVDMRPARDLGARFINEGHGELAFNHPRYPQSAYNRYVAIPLLTKSFARRMKQPHEAWVLRSPWLTDRFTPFHDGIRCFAGDAWYTARRKVIELFLDETPLWKQLHKQFSSRVCPEEAFYHTLAGNSAGLRFSRNNLRYTDWRGCYAHPRTLGREDFPRLLRSGHHFARKFTFDRNLLDGLDKAVAEKAVGSPRTGGDDGGPGVHAGEEWQFTGV